MIRVDRAPGVVLVTDPPGQRREEEDRLCHYGDPSTGETYCGTKVTPRPHTEEECAAAGHGKCVVCSEMKNNV